MQRAWKTVAELLGARRGTVLSIPAEATVHAALERWPSTTSACWSCWRAASRPASSPSATCARKVELRGRTAKTTAVREVMTPEVLYVTPGHTLDRCMVLMKKHRVRHLVGGRGRQGRRRGVRPATSSWTRPRKPRSTSGIWRPTGW